MTSQISGLSNQGSAAQSFYNSQIAALEESPRPRGRLAITERASRIEALCSCFLCRSRGSSIRENEPLKNQRALLLCPKPIEIATEDGFISDANIDEERVLLDKPTRYRSYQEYSSFGIALPYCSTELRCDKKVVLAAVALPRYSISGLQFVYYSRKPNDSCLIL